MAYNARVYRIFIASPSDVEEEREIIAKVIREWNDLYSYERKIVLLPLRWETHSAPELGRRPQDLINTEIVDHADMAVGVFWTRIGTPTGEYASGTIEEIERLGINEKIIMCYFSKAKAELDSVDLDQYKQLKEFKKKTYPNGLIETYSNIVEFRDKFSKQLEIKIRALISKDSSSGTVSAEIKPDLEFEFIEPASKETIGSQYRAHPKVITFSKQEYDKIPAYNTQKHTKGSTLDILVQMKKTYYKEYFDYIRERWNKVPIQFSLKNPSTIAIRDIYIEITCPISKDYEFSNSLKKEPDKYGLSLNYFNESQETLGNGNIFLDTGETTIKIQLTYNALQPQRVVFIDNPLFISANNKQTIDLPIKIYADCFATPISRTLKILIEPKKINKKPLEILEELGIIEK